MCTALKMKSRDTYFGRNLDYEFSYGEEVVLLGRDYPLSFRYLGKKYSHLAILGMAHVVENTPLFYDGCNEAGLAIAGLNFVGSAFFKEYEKGKKSVCQYELVSYILSCFSSVWEVKEALKEIEVVNTPFNEKLPSSQLHYLLSDKEECVVLEFMKDGLHIYDDPYDVLSNNPSFDKMSFLPNLYMGLSSSEKANTFTNKVDLKPFSRGMGAIFLPGDLSSTSRFVRESFLASHSICKEDEASCVSQFFHLLHGVEQQRGACQLPNGKYEITIYTSCMNLEKGIYYYTTYENSRINAIRMNKEDIDSDRMRRFPLRNALDIHYEN